jgi:hypothetical protein
MTLVNIVNNRYSGKYNLLEIIVEKINGIINGEIKDYDSIYKHIKVKIKYEDESIDVKEIFNKYWRYTIFIDKSNNVYLEKVFTGVGTYTKIYKINDKSKKIILLYGSDNEKEEIIEKYN